MLISSTNTKQLPQRQQGSRHDNLTVSVIENPCTWRRCPVGWGHVHWRDVGGIDQSWLNLLCRRWSAEAAERKRVTLGDILQSPWWRHQMEALSTLLALCAGNSPVTGEFPSQRPVTRSFDIFFDLHLNKRLSKQSRGWWFETPSRLLWRHCNGCRRLEIPVTRLLVYQLV